jgi:enoyl-CoA hydratase
VAAVSGHAFAGGLITVAVCDCREAVDEGARFGLNEVPIGIPMPAVCARMLACARGDPVASRTGLFGEVFTSAQAHAMGMMHELAPAAEVLDRAIAHTDLVLDDCLEQYAVAKRACQAAALRDIAVLVDPLADEVPGWFITDHARHAHRCYWAELRGVPAPS